MMIPVGGTNRIENRMPLKALGHANQVIGSTHTIRSICPFLIKHAVNLCTVFLCMPNS